ncbi:MAG: hypothetical protein HYW49_12760 [Deltaproteobacteria bacterium]|nr:hypothetical protein [Deltaproteobacteria bacterium]
MVKKKIIYLVAATVAFLSVLTGVFAHVLNRNFMDTSQAQRRWGHEKFIPEKFKKGDAKIKASMAVSLIETQAFLGRSREEVRDSLGDFSGYYRSGSFPAYIIHEGWQKKGEDTWQLVFLLNMNRKIKAVKIHKNCCDR